MASRADSEAAEKSWDSISISDDERTERDVFRRS
jgi:hypothetical protein